LSGWRLPEIQEIVNPRVEHQPGRQAIRISSADRPQILLRTSNQAVSQIHGPQINAGSPQIQHVERTVKNILQHVSIFFLKEVEGTRGVFPWSDARGPSFSPPVTGPRLREPVQQGGQVRSSRQELVEACFVLARTTRNDRCAQVGVERPPSTRRPGAIGHVFGPESKH